MGYGGFNCGLPWVMMVLVFCNLLPIVLLLPSVSTSVHFSVSDFQCQRSPSLVTCFSFFQDFVRPASRSQVQRIFMMSEELSSVSSKRKRSYKTVSFVWEHFTQIKQGESTVITSAQCNYCKQEFKWKKSDGTSTLTRHLDRCRSYPYNEVNRGDTTYELNDLDINIKNWKFDQELLRKELARMIIVDELPFCFVEKEGFRRFCKMMQPRFRMVSRATVTRDCIQIYNEEKESLKLALQQASSQVCLTTDLWTSIQNLGYMCLTVHFIDKEWRLNKKIVNFCVLPTPHRGENIAKAVDDCLLSWGLDKVCTLTVDNASSNDTAIYHLKERLNSRNLLLLKGDFLHVRCFAHILNLMVKDGINMIAEGINIIRNCVKYIRSSPSRLQCFKKCAARERDVSKKTLCLDVSTRWNSTYMMIEAVLENQKALVSMSYEDTNLSFLRDIDWNVLKSLHKFLEHFYHVTKRISGSKYVTSNMFFKEVNTIMSILKKWCSSVNPAFQKMAKTMKEKFEKYCDLEKVNVMLFMAVVLDPRYKLMYLEFRFNKFYHEEKVGRLMKKVNDTLHRLFDDYSSSLSLLCSSGASSNSMSQVLPSVDIEGIPNVEEVISESQEDWQLFLQDLEKKKSKSELQRYLDDRVEADKSDFNILQWWMSNGSTYPVLSVIARDILSIQISTVASESAFSTGGRILDPFRSCLTPKIVEALVCGQDWLRSSSVPVDIEESLEALEELEIGNFQDAQFGSSSP